jgi:predicted nucleic acid-binding protein
MSATDAFFDTNILVYLVSSDFEKAARSETLLAGGGIVSVQVLNEFVSAARRKTKLSYPEIRGILADVRGICAVKPDDVETHELGLDIAERYRYSVYDSVVIAAALRAGCTVLFSEDMQHGQRIVDLTIQNPYRKTAL